MDAALTIIHRPIKHARLRVREDASILLTVPNSFDQPLIESLLQKKAPWIARKQQLFRKRVSKSVTFAPNEIPLFGEIFRFVPVPLLGRDVVVDDTAKEIRTNLDLSCAADLQRWQRAFATNYLSARTKELSTAHRLPYNRLFIRSQRTKWGTCSTQRNISLNWRLVLVPKYVSDYVILHELMHTKVLNHSYRFWVLLKAVYPQCEEAIRWLRTNELANPVWDAAAPARVN